MSITPTAPQTIGQVLDSSFRIFGASWKQVWPFALAASLLGYAGDAYQLLLAGNSTTEGRPIVVALTLAGAIASIAFYSAIYLRQHSIAADLATGGEVSLGFKLLPRVILMSLALGLAVAASAIPLGVLAAIAIPAMGRYPMPVLIAVGVVLLILPLIVIMRLMLGNVVLLLEDRRAVESLKASARLVKGNWWRAFAILSVGGVILLVSYSLIGFAAAAAAPLLSGRESAVAMLMGAGIGLVLVGLVVTPYFIALMLALYYDLKLRKEGIDLSARIDRLT